MEEVEKNIFLLGLASVCKFLREPPGGPRSGGEAMSEAKPVRWRPERSEGHALIIFIKSNIT